MTFLPFALALLAGLSAQSGDDPATPGTRSVVCRNGQTVPLRLRVSTPSEHATTAVTLPDLVENVVSSWNDRDLSVEAEGAKLFLKLLTKAEGHLDVVTAGGTHVRLYIEPSPAPEPYDSHVTLKAAPEKSAPEAAGKLPDALELVRAMRLGLVPPGASVKRGGNALVSSSAEAECRLAFVYETTLYRGYVLRLTNTSPKAAYHVDVTRLSSPRLVLAGARSLVLAPGKSTLLYLILWK